VQAAERIAGPGTDPAAERKDPITKATAWLRAQGVGEETLFALGEVLSTDRSTRYQRLRRKDEHLFVLFPEGLVGLGGTPQSRLDALGRDGLSTCTRGGSSRSTGSMGAPLTPEASRHLLVLFDNCRADREQPVPAAPVPNVEPSPATDRDAESAKPTDVPGNRRNRPSEDNDPARALVERIRARDPSLPGGVSCADGWLSVSRESVRNWAQSQGIQPNPFKVPTSGNAYRKLACA
jgi:hypothetical protein